MCRTTVHPYRGGPSRRTLDDDDEVQRFARGARRDRRVSVALALTAALVVSFGLIDWPLTAYVLSGRALAR